MDELHLRGGFYEFPTGFNWRAVVALTLAAACALAGLDIPAVRFLYDYSRLVGFAIAFVLIGR